MTPKEQRAWWNPERVQTLINMWLDGSSSRDIGAVFGISRNAVMGKVHRLRGAGKITGLRKVVTRRASTRRRYYARPIVVREPTPQEPSLSIGIMDLESHHCRAITGHGADGLARYCGQPKADVEFNGRMIRSSYCPHHNNEYHNH